ncbi:MAG: XdhC family protein [Ignavibacteriae bacterium]|nr:XdhC family protein [Ignavibacteriota bacterium]MCB9205893.1 XdhC family protein [Ignavibacteriales bacterium]MCB9210738.1 XdhC family protein [Ignavibacteriales bacterium]MCB9219225.1 XdhC family protein [Ignavibacteriales bacterium]MCB9260118.1 XdhC family protein [Ignavibacteriales bacterium]
MKEVDLWIFIYNKLNRNIRVNLLIVADSTLSSPGKTGFKMAISEDVETYGSIGGGIMEFDILNEIRGTLNQPEPVNFIRKLHHSKTKDGHSSGLICGGTQTLIVHTLMLEDRDKIKQIIDNLEEQTNGVLRLNPFGLDYTPNKENDKDITLFFESEQNWQFEENIGLLNTVYVIGGGHVGLAVSRAMATLDFYVVTFDQRDDIITMKNNTYSNKKIITPFNEIYKFIRESKKSYAVIVTPNHDGDKEALKSIIGMKLRYIGLMGSDKKSKSIFSHLESEGINSELFKKVHTPVGLDIEAESPEEIAISIAAEIIKIKNSN